MKIGYWPVVILLIWLLLVLAATLLNKTTGENYSLCVLKSVTGIPCPTCGSTRAGLDLLQGHPVQAVLHNPLVVIAGSVLLLLIVIRLVFHKKLVLDMSRRNCQLVWFITCTLFLANWAYVIVIDGPW